jgi:hypothetical protein
LGNTPTVYRRVMTLPLNAWRGFARMPYVERVSVVGGERLQDADGPFQITLKTGGGAPNVCTSEAAALSSVAVAVAAEVEAEMHGRYIRRAARQKG